MSLEGDNNQQRIYEATKEVCDCGHRHQNGTVYVNNPCSNDNCVCGIFHRNVRDDNYSPQQDG